MVATGSLSIHKAAKWSGIAYSTLQSAVQSTKSTANSVGRRPALDNREELMMVSLLTKMAARGTPLTNYHLAHAAAIIVSHMIPQRRLRIPFRDGKPGSIWLRGFRARHRNRLTFAKPTRQEALRFGACSAEVLTSHFPKLERLIADNNIDSQRLFNLDECGITPARDLASKTQCKRYIPRGSAGDSRVGQFKHNDRTTVMPVISAAGTAGPPLFVLKGKQIPYRTELRNGRFVYETPASRLRHKAVVALRAELGGVDSESFANWARVFVESLQDLLKDGRKVLLVYD